MQSSLSDLYALIVAEFKGVDPVELNMQGARWVMDLDSYKGIRAICRERGAIYPEDDDPEDWVPSPDDRLYGLLIEVRDDGGSPHVVMG